MIWKFDATDGRAAGKVKAALIKNIRTQGKAPADILLFELVFSELVGNVARHAPKTAYVTYTWVEDTLVLSVDDEGAGFTHAPYLPAQPLDESGRGLFLVESLCKRLDITPSKHGGSCVSARLPIYRATARSLVAAAAPSAYSIG